jgi:hypothetical protein
MVALEYSWLLILIFGVMAGLFIGLFFIRSFKSSELAKRSWTIIMAIATALFTIISVMITLLKWIG